MADEYTNQGGRTVRTYSGADDPEMDAKSQSAVDSEERDRQRRRMIAAKEGEASNEPGPPKASDYGGNLAAWSKATREYNEKRASRNPQAAAVKGMLDKKADAGSR